MVKGAQKQMIVIKTGDSRYFDEAYFVLRREIEHSRTARRDMIGEANRILEECLPDTATRAKRTPRAWLLFVGGILCGAVSVLTVCLIVL